MRFIDLLQSICQRKGASTDYRQKFYCTAKQGAFLSSLYRREYPVAQRDLPLDHHFENALGTGHTYCVTIRRMPNGSYQIFVNDTSRDPAIQTPKP